MDIKVSADKLVNGAQALIPYYPIPTGEQIDAILARLCKALDVPFTTQSDAGAIWRQRVRIDGRTRAIPIAELPAEPFAHDEAAHAGDGDG